MIKFFLLSVVFFATNTFRQIIPNKVGVTINYNDTTLKVVYVNKIRNLKLPAFYLNGNLVNETFFYAINPKLIDSINVVKGNLQIENVMYYGQIYIKTKNSYIPKIISLTELKNKYTKLKSEPTIFMINGEIVTTNYDKYMVDENYLFRIIIDKVENAKENVNFNLIKLLTKSEENIKKSKEIMIRGTEVSLTKF